MRSNSWVWLVLNSHLKSECMLFKGFINAIIIQSSTGCTLHNISHEILFFILAELQPKTNFNITIEIRFAPQARRCPTAESANSLRMTGKSCRLRSHFKNYSHRIGKMQIIFKIIRIRGLSSYEVRNNRSGRILPVVKSQEIWALTSMFQFHKKIQSKRHIVNLQEQDVWS